MLELAVYLPKRIESIPLHLLVISVPHVDTLSVYDISSLAAKVEKRWRIFNASRECHGQFAAWADIAKQDIRHAVSSLIATKPRMQVC